MDKLGLLVLGVILSVIAIMNMRGNINTVHSYNRKKVKKEDASKYGKTIGAGTLVIGAALILACAAELWYDALTPYIIVPAAVLGAAIILYGQFKYNRGIF